MTITDKERGMEEPVASAPLKYTPGPWGIIGQPYACFWIVPKEDAETPGPKIVRRIALIEGPRPVYTPHYPIEVAEANARLIAAAPVLLEALRMIAGMESSARPDHMGSIAMLDTECRAGSMRDHARMQVIARAAILQAEGGSP